MRKLFVLPLMLAALAVSGCADKSIFQGGASLVAPIKNPVGRKELAAAWNTYGLVLAGARGYKRSCAAGTIADSCEAVVVQLQGYDNKAYAALDAAGKFVKANPNISAASAVGAAQQAVADFKSIAITNGVVK